MIKLPNTMSFRLTLWFVLAFVSLFSIAFFILYLSMGHLLDTRLDEDLTEDVAELRMLLLEDGIDRLYEEVDREQATGDSDSFFIQILDTLGNTLYTSDLSNWASLSIDQQFIGDINRNKRSVILDTITLDQHDEEIRLIYGKLSPKLIILIGESSEEKDEILEQLTFFLIIVFAIVLPPAAVIGWLIAKKAMHGVNSVSHAVQQIEQGQLNSRVSLSHQQDEIRGLASSFNAMADRIKKLMQEMREMIDNIAHDLRSPLGRIRAISETSLSSTGTQAEFKSAAAGVLEECDHLIHLINTSLDVAEAEAGVAYSSTEKVDVSILLEDACELFDAVADNKHVHLRCTVQKNCIVQGNKPYLQRLISNLIDNALKYTPAHGKVNIQSIQNSSRVNITVSDSGIGIPKADLGRVFERFFRCDNARSGAGCGLGLSFARAIARSHGGDIVLKSIPNHGSSFTLTLPLVIS